MALSLNTENDRNILGLAKVAKRFGAAVEVVTKEHADNASEAVRTITITYQTHSSESRVFNTKEKN
jgi:hypothetical protein